MNAICQALTCDALHRSIGVNQCACVGAPPSGESPPKYPNMVMGIP